MSSRTQDNYCCLTCESFKHYIKKCDDELKKIEYGVSQVTELTDVFGEGLTQERIEFVSTLKDRIEFILKYPQKECTV